MEKREFVLETNMSRRWSPGSTKDVDHACYLSPYVDISRLRHVDILPYDIRDGGKGELKEIG